MRGARAEGRNDGDVDAQVGNADGRSDGDSFAVVESKEKKHQRR